ncbi:MULTISPECIES: hypothetical protein [Mycobacterium]|nr:MULTISPECIES: hypothetical protein [Mycobacterium]
MGDDREVTAAPPDDEFMSPEEFSDFVKTANEDVARPMCAGSLQPPLQRRAAKHSRSHVADLHPHGICATCGQDYPVLVDGTLASHPAGIPWPDVDHLYLRAERTDRRQLKMAASITGLSTFRRERGAHVDDAATAEAFVEFSAARMHFETTDRWPSLSGCREWRATVRVSALDGHRDDIADLEVAAVQFLVLQAGYESPAEVLPLFGPRAATFVDLFDDDWLDPELDESEDFAADMPISTILVVLEAVVDTNVAPDSPLRAWALAETIHTMLPTTAGLVLMPALPSAAEPRHTLIPTDHIDPDCVRIGCRPVPGHPRFTGQATAYVYLEEARQALADVRDTPIRISLPR